MCWGLSIESNNSVRSLLALDAAAAQQWLPGDSGLGTAPQQLSRALAAREIDANSHFFDYLKQRQLLVAAINNPRYASRKVAEEKWRGGS
jgi:hypothetical protein